MTFNQALIATMITRQIDLLRYEKAVRTDVFAVLDNIQHDISGSLKLPDIEKTVTNGYTLILNALDVLPVLDAELLWLSATMGGLAAAYGLRNKIVPLAKKGIQALANQFTVGGLRLPETIAKQRNDLILKLKSLIRSAAIDDRQPEIDEIADVFKRAKQTAQTMTKTWINSVAHTAHEAFARVNPLIKGYRHISVLDSGTTALCTHRHGLLWDKKHNPIEHAQIFKRPPLHYNCRSKLVYVYDLKEEFDGFSGDDWVKSRSLEELQQQFGVGIGKMLFDGKIKLADALDGLRPLTLIQLQGKLAQKEYGTTLSRAVFEVSNVQSVLRELPQHLPRIQAFAQKHHLSETDYTALFLYSRLGRVMNLVAYAPEKFTKRNLAAWQELNTATNIALDKLPDYVGNVTRRMKIEPDFLAKHQIGQVITYDSFTSASLYDDVLKYPVKLLIQSKHGKLIQEISALPHQREVLFKMGTQFKVLDYQEQGKEIWITLTEM
ncbi:ADP-ribosyltransferase domain-containing protein [Wielerella bovis]|uniref:ADP-ribosyltransferase domain-containing protein n=1 Tax=Wielerella bovis TaxID=2917790 RepID=UPI00201A0B5E|nr:ADP-ribosyltransferase domain-containing protein [Wielerella bovis]ULJ65929.1 ADP-ribosyltransferase domain-containing protein [Wielerella bovis]